MCFVMLMIIASSRQHFILFYVVITYIYVTLCYFLTKDD